MIDVARLQPGDLIPPLSRGGAFEVWSRFAAVNYEIAGHHMDDDVARHEGFPAAFAMAPLTFSYIQTMLRDWVGDDGRIVSVAIQLRSPFLRGRTLLAAGRVTAVRRSNSAGAECEVDVEVWADDDEGTRLVQGTGTVAVSESGAVTEFGGAARSRDDLSR